MITVDTNLIAYLTIPGPLTDSARAVYKKDPDWSAPMLWRSEYRNVLALYLRKSLLTIEKAIQLDVEAAVLMSGREYQPDSEDVLRLAEKSRLSGYDCEFISVAKHLGTHLITSDKEILKAFPKFALNPTDYLSP